MTSEKICWPITCLGAAALAIQFVFLLAAGALTHLADVDFQLDLRRRMAAHLGQVPLGWFTLRSTGAVKKALEDDVAALHHLVGHSYTNMVSAAVSPLAALVYLGWVNWRLALAALLPVALGIVLYRFQYRGYGDRVAAYNRSLEGVNAASIAFVQGIAVVKTFGQARRAHGRFIECTRAFVATFWDWVRAYLALSAATEAVLSPLFALAVVLVCGLALISVGASEAARLASVDEVVARLPQGFATRVGEGGTALSGGERQRVSIARVILKDAPVVLLDEATAALDPINEAAVQQGFRVLTRDKTLVVVAHRLQNLRAAGRILFLDRGRIVEHGTHDELIAAHGRYTAFWNERTRAAGWRLGRRD